MVLVRGFFEAGKSTFDDATPAPLANWAGAELGVERTAHTAAFTPHLLLNRTFPLTNDMESR